MPVSALALALECADEAQVPAALAHFGFEEIAAAQRHMTGLADRLGDPPFAVRFLETLLGHLAECADADMALNNFDRWSAQLASLHATLSGLTGNARLLADLVTLFASSQYLADILVREPTAYTLLQDGDAGVGGQGSGVGKAHSLPTPDPRPPTPSFEQAMAPFHRPASKLEALRRLKRREFLHIGWRDYTGRWALPEVVAAISELADGLIRGALEVVRSELDVQGPAAPIRFSVIAMGKLGGRELNYSSDVDLLFVYEESTDAGGRGAGGGGRVGTDRSPPTPDPRPPTPDAAGLRSATRLAEGLVAALSTATAEGHLFRVDMRLRPEGRYGALVRSLASFREYYDRFIETWERQALLKARFVAGDAELGARFLAMVEPRVYRQTFSAAIFDDVREVKQAIERRVAAAGESATNVKEGRGTIRDIEFTVQLLQLLFGGQRPELRTGNTLQALDRLAAAGLLTPEERDTIRDHYSCFRTVEHRLQLMADLPIRLIPDDPRERARLSRRMGFRENALAAFDADYRLRADAVHAITGEILLRFGGEGSAPEGRLRPLILGIREPEARAALREELAQRGFLRPERSMELLESLATGGTRYSLPVSTRRLFADLAGGLIAAAAASPDPDGALAAVEAMTHRVGTHRAVYQSMAEAPESLAALCRLTGTSPLAAETLLRHPEWRELLSDPQFLEAPPSLEALLAEARARLAATRSPAQRPNTLRRFHQRERLRILARDILLDMDVEVTTAELALLAEACLRVALEDFGFRISDFGFGDSERQEAPSDPLSPMPNPKSEIRNPKLEGFAVIALGRLGGSELHYGSDLDLFYLFDPARHPGHPSHRDYEALAAELTRSLGATTEEGTLYEVDLRLRPEGRQGFVAAHIDAYRRYYETRAQTWEKQSLIKARFVAGDAALAEEFLEWVTPLVYPETPLPEREAEVRAMKRRIETERVRPGERSRHLKLGPGGLSDVEFLVQSLQMRYGGREPELRQPNTIAALEALARAGHLTTAERTLLRDGYRFLTRLRQRLALTSPDRDSSVLPQEDEALRRLARSMQFADPEELLAEHARVTAAIRELFQRRFYE